MGTGLRIELDRETYRLGEQVLGRVVVDDPQGDAVEVALVHTCGGAVLRAGRRRLRLAGGEATFALPIPVENAVHTHARRRGAAAWKVEARLDVPWALDPTTERTLTVEPCQVASLAEYEQLRGGAPPPRADPQGLLVMATLLVLVAPLVLLVAYLVLTFSAFVAPVLVPLGLAVSASRASIRMRLRRFALRAPRTGPVFLGEWIPFELSFRLLKPIEIEGLVVRLECSEGTSPGSGAQHRAEPHVHGSEVTEVLGPGVIAPEPGTVSDAKARVWLRVPADGLPSTGGVVWKATAELGVVGWPDPKAETTLRVVSAALPALAAPPRDEPLAGQHLIVASEAEGAPSRIDPAELRERLWPWLVAPTLGALCIATGVAVLAEPALAWGPVEVGGRLMLFPEPELAFAVGIMALVGGVVAFLWRLSR